MTVEHKSTSGMDVGAELFHATPDRINGAGTTGFTIGMIAPIRTAHSLLLSVGRDLRGDNIFSIYAAYERSS